MTQLKREATQRQSVGRDPGRAIVALICFIIAAAVVSAGVALAIGSWFKANVDEIAESADESLGVDERHRRFVEQVAQDIGSITGDDSVTASGLRRDFRGRIDVTVSASLSAAPTAGEIEELGELSCSSGAGALSLSIDLLVLLDTSNGPLRISCDDASQGVPVAALASAVLELPVDELKLNLNVDEKTSAAELYGQVWLGSLGTGAGSVDELGALASQLGFESKVVLSQ
jgi:hypothetical protein